MAMDRGTLLNSRYRIVEILGQGGMGSVYRAIDENLGVEVAVKDNFFTTDEYARQFRREATILASLRHPNLPRVTDHFVIEDQGQYLVMDFVGGEDLRQRMDRVGLILEEDAILIGAAISDALAYLGSCNPPIVHRDIKPGNVKITADGKIYLVDFGLAKVLVGSQMTTTGARAMTPGYSPPEQYGTARTDQRSDIYSLGATLYAALTGVIPEDALSRAMDQAELTPIRRHNPRVSKRVAAAIEKSLEVHPDDRYQDADEFKQALLNAGSATRKREGEFLVSPPPEGDIRQTENGLEGVDIRTPKSSGVGVDDLSPFPIPISSPSPDSRRRKSRPRSRRRRQNRLLPWILFLLILAISLSAIAYVRYPSITSLATALNLMPSAITTEPVIIPPLETQTPTPETSQALPTDSNPGIVLPLNNSPTKSLSATEKPVPPVTLTPTPLPTPMGGGQGEIVIASDATGRTQLYLVNMDGTNLQQITNIPEGACQPDWSPDGTKLVFISPCEGNQELYPGSALFILDLNSGDILPLPTTPGGDFDPDWSPDGSRIAFTSLRKGGRPQLYEYRFDDNSIEILSDPKTFSIDVQPAWSPDGNQLLFVTTRKGPSQIWLMNLPEKTQDRLSSSGGSINTHPRWSPDGKVLLYTQRQDSAAVPMVVFSSLEEEGLSDYRLTADNIPVREAHYSPDGIWVVFESWPGGSNHDIYVMTTNGANRLQLTTNPRLDFDPAWRPKVIAP